MKTLNRWGDKATFFTIIAVIIISFIASIVFIGILYMQTNELLSETFVCAMSKDSDCFASILNNESIFNMRIISTLACITSINGIMASLVFITIYRLRS